jgi:DNA-binding transcriptional LysR family regulator
MANEPAWHLYRSLLAVLREGSLSAAARRLKSTQPTLGRHIEELEQAIGVALFTRAPDGLRPTPAAHAMRPMAEAMEAAAAAMVRTAGTIDDAVSGTVRITANEVMGTEVLPPLLAVVRKDHPRLVLELAINNQVEDLVRREADIAVRMERPRQNALIARKVGTVSLGFFARRDYLDRAGTPRTFEDLFERHLVGFDRDDRSARRMITDGPALDRSRFAVRSDSHLAQMAAIRAGLGIGVMQRRLAARDPDLQPVLAASFDIKLEVWLAMHEDQRANRPVRTVFDGLGDALAGWIGG